VNTLTVRTIVVAGAYGVTAAVMVASILVLRHALSGGALADALAFLLITTRRARRPAACWAPAP
jgi:hypothetical protein